MIRRFALMLVGIALAGCVTQPMGAPQASMELVQKLRAADLPAMKVGKFAPSPSLRPGADRSANIRALTLVSPVDKSFAKYLGRTVEANLQAAGRFDSNSDLVIDGVLTEADVSSMGSMGTAVLGARFSLKRTGQKVFEKHLQVDSSWDSAFLGVVAIPDAANHYTMLFDQLTANLFTDPDFVAAVKRK